MNDWKEIAELITALFISKGKQMPQGTLNVWVPLLQEYPFEDLKDAFIQEMKSKNEWPTVGHIVAAVLKIIKTPVKRNANYEAIHDARSIAREKYLNGHREEVMRLTQSKRAYNPEANLY